MAERILVLGGSRQGLEGLKQLKALGLELVVCDFDADAPGFLLADHKILASVYHIEDCLPAVVAFHQKTPINGVMCLACDVPHIVARIASKLGLPGVPVEVADRAVNKLDMKEKFARDDVAVPKFWATENSAAIKQIFRGGINELVVKPVDSRGSKGVSRLTPDGDLTWAFRYAQENSPSGQVMVEEYLTGPQVSTESIVIDGEAITPALSDRSYELLDKYYPFIVENGGDMPSALPEGVISSIRELVDKAAKSLGVVNGIVKGDIVVHRGNPYVIELAARLSGGYFCTHQIPFSTGVKLVEACAYTALGRKLDKNTWAARKEVHVSTRWKIVEAGKIASIPPASTILKMPGVLAFEHWLTVGDTIVQAQNAAASVAMIQAEGRSQTEARECAEKALATFEPEIVPHEGSSRV